MNLIYILTFALINSKFINSLKINELKIDNFIRPQSLDEVKDKDFLDVDVSSDILTANVALYDASSEPVNQFRLFFINFLVGSH